MAYNDYVDRFGHKHFRNPHFNQETLEDVIYQYIARIPAYLRLEENSEKLESEENSEKIDEIHEQMQLDEWEIQSHIELN